MLWEGAAVAGLEFFQPLAPVATQRLISGYALTEQKSFDTIDVSHSLGDERFALAAEVAAVFLVGSGHVDHCTDPRFAALVGEQRSNQSFTIDLVGLCPPAPARCCNRGRVDDMAFDAFVLERPVNPKPVEIGLLYNDDPKALTRPPLRLLLKLCEALHQPGEIAAGTECFDIFSPPPGDSEVISQLERLNSNETKIAPRWVWIAVNGSDLSATTFMVSSKMDGSDRHF